MSRPKPKNPTKLISARIEIRLIDKMIRKYGSITEAINKLLKRDLK